MEEEAKAKADADTFALLLVALLGNMSQCMYLLHGSLLDVQANLKGSGSGHCDAVSAALKKRARSVWAEIRDMPATMQALRDIIAAMPAVQHTEGGAQ